jgi:hypothetical protein
MGSDERPDREKTLVEGQGVNAGAPVDQKGPARPRERTSAGPPPDERVPDKSLPEEMVGVPEQKHGYPGQQRSVDTS